MEKAEREKQRYQERKAAHVCTHCGRKDARTLAGGAYCESCMAKNRRNREARKALGKKTIPRPTAVKAVKPKRKRKRSRYGPKVSCPYAIGLEEYGQYACLYCKRPGGCVHDREDAVWELKKS